VPSPVGGAGIGILETLDTCFLAGASEEASCCSFGVVFLRGCGFDDGPFIVNAYPADMASSLIFNGSPSTYESGNTRTTAKRVSMGRCKQSDNYSIQTYFLAIRRRSFPLELTRSRTWTKVKRDSEDRRFGPWRQLGVLVPKRSPIDFSPERGTKTHREGLIDLVPSPEVHQGLAASRAQPSCHQLSAVEQMIVLLQPLDA
jgi:hypothetical protein